MFKFTPNSWGVDFSQHNHKSNAFIGRLKSTTLGILLLFLNSTVFAQFGGPSAVKVAKVQAVMMVPVRKVPANVQAKFVSTIKAESRGVVNKLAEIGGMIKQGDVLAELIDSQSKLRSQELKDAVNSASAKYIFLKSENARLKDLLAKSLISNSELEQNQSDYLSAQSDLAQAQSRHNQYKDQVTKLTIVAPFDGHVMQQFAQPGQLLNSGDNVLEFMQDDNLEVVVYVPFKFKSQINNGAGWKILTSDNRIIEATINNFIPAATGMSRTIEVHLSVNDKNLWPGESVNVMVPKQARQKVVAVPRDALVIRQSETFVYTIVENKSHKVDVITGIAEGELIAVKGLLSAGDIVVVRGNERLRPGQEVKIIEND
ncbi:MAG: efflux RND transporter periplasmic adaptor subunit [Proteobacteria bacterium]|nr:efflux RND transporter periplasmic adaptor subunit [Pseudomonadota bacterium]